MKKLRKTLSIVSLAGVVVCMYILIYHVQNIPNEGISFYIKILAEMVGFFIVSRIFDKPSRILGRWFAFLACCNVYRYKKGNRTASSVQCYTIYRRRYNSSYNLFYEGLRRGYMENAKDGLGITED